jgi:hypothetical protein
MDYANSINGVPIRLSYERWYHVIENHDELASQFYDVLDTVERPTVIIRGSHGALKAVRNLGKGKWLVVIYKELSRKDGFVITAYTISSKPKGEVIWRV